MSKFTPGPWKIMPEDGVMSGNYRGIVAGKGYLDKQTNTGFNVTAWMSESDARLISCAPELLEALKYFVQLIEDGIDTTIIRQTSDGAFTQAQELIARIQGGE